MVKTPSTVPLYPLLGIGGDFTRSWLSLPLSHSTKVKGGKKINTVREFIIWIYLDRCFFSGVKYMKPEDGQRMCFLDLEIGDSTWDSNV